MKVLFYGLGGVGQRHLRILKKLRPEIKIGAVRRKNRAFEIGDDMQPDFDTDIIKKYDIETFEKKEEGFEFKPDFAVVSNPTSLHVETCLDLVRHDIPVLLEKPISHDMEGLKELKNISIIERVSIYKLVF